MKMEKGCPPQESAPPYPGPPLNYEGAGPQPETYSQPVVYSQPGVHSAAPPPATYQGSVPYAAAAPITTVTHVVVTPMLYDYPGQAFCQHCQQSVTTQTDPKPNAMTWTFCAICCLLGCWPCSCIICILDSCQDVEHHCPLCNRIIYVYRQM